MTANNILALELCFKGALVSVGARCQCVRMDPKYKISGRVPVVSPRWTVETQRDGTKRLVQHCRQPALGRGLIGFVPETPW